MTSSSPRQLFYPGLLEYLNIFECAKMEKPSYVNFMAYLCRQNCEGEMNMPCVKQRIKMDTEEYMSFFVSQRKIG